MPTATTGNDGASDYVEDGYFHLQQGIEFDDSLSFDSLLAGTEPYNWVRIILSPLFT